MHNILSIYNTIFNGARKGVAYPTAGLQVIVYNSTYEDEGTTYLRTSIGVGIPLVSGTGLDAIYDFSGLNDLRLNKNAYLGNSFSLPEYYDYPYSASIYFDTGNPYHWKLTDFHYANFLEQSLTVDNIAFLKATATTDTSNVIASIDALYIYSTEQTGSNLTKLRKHIGIQDNFTGNEILADSGFDNGYTDWQSVLGGVISNGKLVTDPNESVSGARTILNNVVNIGTTYQVCTTIDDIDTGIFTIYLGRAVGANIAINETLAGNYCEAFTVPSHTGDGKVYCYASGGATAIIDNVSIKQFYENYYKGVP